jgi:hypothetical protein
LQPHWRWPERHVSLARADRGDVLPLGVGTICLDSTPATAACDGAGDAYVIRVTWDDNRSGAADVNDPNENIVLSFRP